jgi:hypothetical protein
MLNKKAMEISPIYFIIAGILMFLLVSCTLGNAAVNAFKSYKGAEQSFQELTTALVDVSNKSNNLALQLVGLNMEENTALFIFQKDTDLQLGFRNEVSKVNMNMLIEKPTECVYSDQCVCLCKDFKLKPLLDTKSADELNAKYAGKYSNLAPANMYSAECGRGIECESQHNFSIPNRLTLSEVVSGAEITRIEAEGAKQNQARPLNYIYLWTGGFVIWRLSDSAQSKSGTVFQSNQFMSSKYVDLYVVNNNINVKICLDPKCGLLTNTNTP